MNVYHLVIICFRSFELLLLSDILEHRVMAGVDNDCSDNFLLPTQYYDTFDIANLLKVTEKGVLKWEGRLF